jgi:hypothetical protein
VPDLTRLAFAGWLVLAELGGAPALAQFPHQEPAQRPPAALDVPYLSQSILLCGGAALAMVERWWGRRGVFAEDFANLVRPAEGGIRTSDLATAARSRGWDVRVLSGTPELIHRQLADSVPVVALIRVAPDRYHYVVVIGWRDGVVSFHDPARGPFMTLDESGFLERWNATDRWSMALRPMPAPAPLAAMPASLDTPGPLVFDSLPCRPWLDRAIDAAAERRLPEAFRLLEQARLSCPGEPLVLREMAGVRFKEGRHHEVIRLAGEYLILAPGDEAGWQLLATSRYLSGDPAGALAAWNRLGRPTVDLVRIDGLHSIRFREVEAAASLLPGTRLTASRLALARRRVGNVPALRRAVVEYQPVPGGLVELRVAVTERPLMDRAWRLIATGAVRALAQREASLEVASPTGKGELWSGTLRWNPARPTAAARVDLPGSIGFPGVVTLEGSWARFRVEGREGAGGLEQETRRAGSIGFGGWLTGGFHPSAHLGVERWSEQRDYLTLTVGAELRASRNRFALSASGTRGIALSTDRSHTRGGIRASWATSRELRRSSWSARLGGEWTSARSPTGLWPVAGSAVAWAVPLRAQSLEGDQVVAGRAMIHGGIAGDHPVAKAGPIVLAAGAFLDAAGVLGAAGNPAGGRWYLDGGVGVRIGIGDGRFGILRIDLARGLATSRRTAVTIGVHRTWPLFELSR